MHDMKDYDINFHMIYHTSISLTYVKIKHHKQRHMHSPIMTKLTHFRANPPCIQMLILSLSCETEMSIMLIHAPETCSFQKIPNK